MAVPVLRQISLALRTLDPGEVRKIAERDFTLGVWAEDDAVWSEVLSFLLPPETSPGRAREAGKRILRIERDEDFEKCDFGLAEAGLPHPASFVPFSPQRPRAAMAALLDENEAHWIPLARAFPSFRDPVVERIIWQISKENALFAVATAIPHVIPSWISLPWAVGEFASDTAFLTMNQVRMAFLIAAASDNPIGYLEQRGQVGSILAAAFGWRALAREMVSKIPAGGGLVPKGLVALAGTYVVGAGIDRIQRFGHGLTQAEKEELYARTVERGRSVVQEMVDRLRGRDTSTQDAAGSSQHPAAS